MEFFSIVLWSLKIDIDPFPDLHNSVSEHGVKALFIEPQLSQDIVDPFADDVNLPIYVIDPLGGLDNRQSYIELIKYNVDTIYQALK